MTELESLWCLAAGQRCSLESPLDGLLLVLALRQGSWCVMGRNGISVCSSLASRHRCLLWQSTPSSRWKGLPPGRAEHQQQRCFPASSAGEFWRTHVGSKRRVRLPICTSITSVLLSNQWA